MAKIKFLKGIVFLAAFLLFQIELIVSKTVLPEFGGGYLVWGGCVAFFQFVLFLGYLYAHFVVRKVGIIRYNSFHLILLILSVATFFTPLPRTGLDQSIPLVLGVFLRVLLSVGLVFFILSTISVIAQVWLASSRLPERVNPYSLYAVSNAASLLALLSYPLFFEPLCGLEVQLRLWRCGYLFLTVLYALAWYIIPSVRNTGYGASMFPKDIFPLKRTISLQNKEPVLWFLAAAAGSIIFLSVTNIMTYEVAPCPVLWILPLSVYLLSFVLNFRQKPFCPRWIEEKYHFVLGFGALLFFFTKMRILPVLLEMAAYSFLLFAICMLCQRRLAQLKPRNEGGLTFFYLVIAAGSSAGSFLIIWAAPLLLYTANEYLFGLFVVSLLVFSDEKRMITIRGWRAVFYLLLTILLWPMVFKQYNLWGVIIISFIFAAAYGRIRANPAAVSVSLALVFAASFFLEPLWSWSGGHIYLYRNYYGIYKVSLRKGVMYLYNGTTLHGAQYLNPVLKPTPLSYYHFQTPAGKLLKSDFFVFNRMGVVGLGVGTLSAYAKTGQMIDFYELDKEALPIAGKYFSYLKDSEAKIRYFFGDARVSLRRASSRVYDILIVDAFSGDSVPVHLLTTDSIAEYKEHLADDGIILFHVSNRYFNLVRVLSRNAEYCGARAVFSNNHKKNKAMLGSSWVALTWDEQAAKKLVSLLNWKDLSASGSAKDTRPWSDDYSDVVSAADLRGMSRSLKAFQPFYW